MHNTKLKQLHQQYRLALPQKAAAISQAWQDLKQSDPEHAPAAEQILQKLLHNLAGSAAMYELPRLGSLARSALLHLKQQQYDDLTADILELTGACQPVLL